MNDVSAWHSIIEDCKGHWVLARSGVARVGGEGEGKDVCHANRPEQGQCQHGPIALRSNDDHPVRRNVC